MAGLQSRNGSWRIIFWYAGKQHSLWLGEVKELEAQATSAKVDYWLMRLKQNLVRLPTGCDIVTFIQHDGKPPDFEAAIKNEWTLSELQESYFRSQEKKLEQTTLAGIRLHFNHLFRILGAKRLVASLCRADLQSYVDKRMKEWIDPNIYRKQRRAKAKENPPKRNHKRKTPKKLDEPEKPRRHPSSATVRKEMVSLRTAWNWARRNLDLKEEFPGAALDYAKTEESLPFMTWEEASEGLGQGISLTKSGIVSIF